MKKSLILLCSIITAGAGNAQEPADALRFSWTVPSGTARQQAIGGAMTSLGGDLSATFINPAGLAFYRTGDFVVSPYGRSAKNKSTYLDRKETEKEEKFSLGTTGFVKGSRGYRSGKLRNTAFSLAFNTTADFRSDILYRGQNTQSSYTQKYTEELNNARINSLVEAEEDFSLGSSLAYNIGLVDTLAGGSPRNYQFASAATPLVGSGLLQEQRIKNRGGIYEAALGLAANYNEKLLVGGSLALPYLYYRREAGFSEVDPMDVTNGFNFMRFEEELTTSGIGFNARLGLIYKPQEFWRLGLALHSPTVFHLTDKYETTVVADLERTDGKILADYSRDYTNNQPLESKYILVTPYRVMGSVSYVIREIQDVTRQRGFLTADVEYVNYKASSFQADEDETGGNTGEYDAYYAELNEAIDRAYKGAFNFKAGGELKFTTIMVRLGAAYYGNPYKNLQGEKGSRLNLSGGLGYRNKGYFIDLTYVHRINKDAHVPYRLESMRTPVAAIRSQGGNVMLSVGLKF